MNLLNSSLLLLMMCTLLLASDDVTYRWHVSTDPDLVIPGHVLAGAIPVVTFTGHEATLLTQCALACLKLDHCRSYNFNEHEGICEINQFSHLDVSTQNNLLLERDPQFSYFKRDALVVENLPILTERLECEAGGVWRWYYSHTGQLSSQCHCRRGRTGPSCQQQAPVPEWSTWSEWSACGGSCDWGARARSRSCLGQGGDELDVSLCAGRSRELERCQLISCDYTAWLPWSPWSACTSGRLCGPGVQSRRRDCVDVRTNGTTSGCTGVGEDLTPCNSPHCDAPVKLVNGSVFGEGDVMVYDDVTETWRYVCGDHWSMANARVACREIGFGGAHNALAGSWDDALHDPAQTVVNVSCDGEEPNLVRCPHGLWNTTAEENRCDLTARVQCVVNGGWGAWNTWSECSVTCGDGLRMRNRSCNYPEPRFGGNTCPGNNTQFKICQQPKCKVDGAWLAWDSWSECSTSCGNGTRSRQRECVPPLYGGAPCGGLYNETEHCFLIGCPVDGVWSEWLDWSSCSLTCGLGTRWRQRQCTEPIHNGAPCEGNNNETETCLVRECPVDGFWSGWYDWSTCSVSCDQGTRWRHRDCTEPLYGGNPCQGSNNETETCLVTECPVDGVWLAWSEWSECSVTCDTGTRERHRECIPPRYGGAPCGGSGNETETCTLDPCRAPGLWATWGEWALCSVTCGGGIRERIRECIGEDGGVLGAESCDEDPSEQQHCHEYDCLPIAESCTAWRDQGMIDTVSAEIDPGGRGSPFWVRCDIESDDGIGVTEIAHDQMERRRVHGYEVAGEFSMMLTYNTSLQNVVRLVDSSEWCRQFIKWECVSAAIKNPHNADEAMTYWANRDGMPMFYWGGADPASDSCACGVDDSCDKAGKRCNCDANDRTMREDSGYLEELLDLPVTQFLAGDTGGVNEYGYITFGPVQCGGTVDINPLW